MLYATCGPHSDPSRLKEIINKELAPLIKLRTEPQKSAQHEDRLANLIDKAIQFDFILQATKANVSIEMRDPETQKLSGFPFKEVPKVMEKYPNCYFVTDSLQIHDTAEMIVHPSLRLYGTMPFNPMHEKLAYRFLEHGAIWTEYDKSISAAMKAVVGQFPEPDEEDTALEGDGGKTGQTSLSE